MIRVLIVENEKSIADYFSELILRLFSDVYLLPVCDTVEKSLSSIRSNAPDLVFLDVELNNGETGFDILRHLSSVNFEVIFVTGFNKYAVQAIKFSALDYLLKPVTEDDLSSAMHRFAEKKNSFNPKQLEILLSGLHKGATMNQVALPTMQGLDFVAIDSIVYCEGESNQTAVYLLGKDLPMIVSRTLKYCQDLFSGSEFFRIHKSYLINLNHIKKYMKGKDGQVLMSNSKTLEVSRNYKEAFLEHLKTR